MSPDNFNVRDSEKGPIQYDATERTPVIIGVYSYKADSDLSALLSII